MGPHAGQARKKILVLSQFDLKLSFPRSGSLCKNIQDETGAVQNLNAEILGQNPHLGRGELIVEDSEIAVMQRDQLFHLRYFAVTDKAAGIRRGAILDQRDNHLTARGFHKCGQLLHGTV